jgi:hypothetical protein
MIFFRDMMGERSAVWREGEATSICFLEASAPLLLVRSWWLALFLTTMASLKL